MFLQLKLFIAKTFEWLFTEAIVTLHKPYFTSSIKRVLFEEIAKKIKNCAYFLPFFTQIEFIRQQSLLENFFNFGQVVKSYFL